MKKLFSILLFVGAFGQVDPAIIWTSDIATKLQVQSLSNLFFGGASAFSSNLVGNPVISVSGFTNSGFSIFNSLAIFNSTVFFSDAVVSSNRITVQNDLRVTNDGNFILNGGVFSNKVSVIGANSNSIPSSAAVKLYADAGTNEIGTNFSSGQYFNLTTNVASSAGVGWTASNAWGILTKKGTNYFLDLTVYFTTAAPITVADGFQAFTVSGAVFCRTPVIICGTGQIDCYSAMVEPANSSQIYYKNFTAAGEDGFALYMKAQCLGKPSWAP